MVESPHLKDPDLNIPVFSLYGEAREPTKEQLSLIDILLIDLQDVGCRVYTYIWTLYLAMAACSRAGVEVVVLDRPNPIGGDIVEGNLLQEDSYSFVGYAPIPMRHGMTMGELAGFFLRILHIPFPLHVIKMNGWKRNMYFKDTHLPWVFPSPNMPTFDTAMVYPGQVLLEGTNISEGRGTTRPFEIFGAPFLRCKEVRREMEKQGLSGFILREQAFEPTFQKWAGERCLGFQIHVTDHRSYQPYLTSLALISAIKKLHPEDFQWKMPPYEYEFERLPMDLIVGNQKIRRAVEQGAKAGYLKAMMREDEKMFEVVRRPFLLYD
jgi:uncharacterized protein YbbC (DUF1343 family)